jgi:hypothetical protein
LECRKDEKIRRKEIKKEEHKIKIVTEGNKYIYKERNKKKINHQ